MPMNVLTPRTLAAAAMSALTLAAIAAPAGAATVTDDFEGAPPAGYTRLFGNEPGGESRLSTGTEPAQGNTSVVFSMPDVDNGYSRVTLDAPNFQPYGKLRDVSATFDTYIDPTSDVVLPPYLLFGLDNNGDGHYDFNNETLVIQFSSQVGPPYTTGTFITDGLNSSNDVHVQVDRGTLGAGEFQPDSTPDQLADLYDRNYDATTLFGDLNVYRVRVAAGFFAAGPGDQDYLAYVDNLSVTGPGAPAAVPEPLAGLGLLGLLGLGVVRRGKRVE